MYKVLIAFTDDTDGYCVYQKGEIYPKEGASPTDERIEYLCSSSNALGKPVIAVTQEGSTQKNKPKKAAKTAKKGKE